MSIEFANHALTKTYSWALRQEITSNKHKGWPSENVYFSVVDSGPCSKVYIFLGHPLFNSTVPSKMICLFLDVIASLEFGYESP